MGDTPSVQENKPVVQEPVQPAVEPASQTTTPAAVAPKPVVDDAVKQIIAEAVARAVEQGRNVGKRELQSAQDRNKAEAARIRARAESAEKTLGVVRERIRTTDPEMARELELEELRGRERYRTTVEQDEAAQKAQEEFVSTFYESLTQHIEGLGISLQDPRLDWGTEGMTNLEIQRKVLASVNKIQKENIQSLNTGFEKRLKDLEAKLGQVNVEVNSVTTEAPAGAPAGSDAEFVKKFGSGDLPMTKANLDRYNKITASY